MLRSEFDSECLLALVAVGADSADATDPDASLRQQTWLSRPCCRVRRPVAAPNLRRKPTPCCLGQATLRRRDITTSLRDCMLRTGAGRFASACRCGTSATHAARPLGKIVFKLSSISVFFSPIQAFFLQPLSCPSHSSSNLPYPAVGPTWSGLRSVFLTPRIHTSFRAV